MRTTLTIDDDLLAALKKSARDSGQSLKCVVNATLRNGLTNGAKPPQAESRFRVASAPRGFMPGLNPMKLNQLADELEVEAILQSGHKFME